MGEAADFPLGIPEALQAEMLATPYMPAAAVRMLAGEPVAPALEAWWQAYVRSAASPSTSLAMRRWLLSVDVRAALPAIRCPTLVLARRDAWIGLSHARFIAKRIPGARLVELAGAADFLFTGEIDPLLSEIEEFVTGQRPAPSVDRVLATVLYTDIVDSTIRASAMGDRRWRHLLDEHDRVVREELTAGSGREIKTTGDGFLAAFDGPARASAAPWRSVTACGVSGWRSVQGCTPGRSSCAVRTSEGSPCTSGPA